MALQRRSLDETLRTAGPLAQAGFTVLLAIAMLVIFSVLFVAIMCVHAFIVEPTGESAVIAAIAVCVFGVLCVQTYVLAKPRKPNLGGDA